MRVQAIRRMRDVLLMPGVLKRGLFVTSSTPTRFLDDYLVELAIGCGRAFNGPADAVTRLSCV